MKDIKKHWIIRFSAITDILLGIFTVLALIGVIVLGLIFAFEMKTIPNFNELDEILNSPFFFFGLFFYVLKFAAIYILFVCLIMIVPLILSAKSFFNSAKIYSKSNSQDDLSGRLLSTGLAQLNISIPMVLIFLPDSINDIKTIFFVGVFIFIESIIKIVGYFKFRPDNIPEGAFIKAPSYKPNGNNRLIVDEAIKSDEKEITPETFD